jgi:hypothetical protein
MIRFLNGIAAWRHHSQVRNSPWTRFFNGDRATKIISAAPFRPQCSWNPFLSPQGASSAKRSFLEGALSKAGLLNAKR